MPFLDETAHKVVVRIVFDGPARAGKTTNLKALCDVFSSERRSDLQSPGELAGRTTLFDWLQVDSGVVAGRGLRSIFLTVPGQRVLSRRRFALIDRADAVVYVVDGSRDSYIEAAQMFATLTEHCQQLGALAPPIVVQVNKQDLYGNLSEAEVRAELGIAQEIRVVFASAEQGVGVREVAAFAMRLAAEHVQARLSSQEPLESGHYDANFLKEELLELERGQSYSPVAALNHRVRVRASSSAVQEKIAAAEVPRHLPLLPSAQVDSGCVWPAANGRMILREIEQEKAEFRPDFLVSEKSSDTAPSSETYVFRAGKYCLKTSGRRTAEDFDVGRANLLSLARSKVMLGDLLPQGTVVSLHPGSDGKYWLWTCTPWLVTLRAEMDQAEKEKNEELLGVLLGRYAEAVCRTLELAVRQGVILDVHPANFSAVGNDIAYLDDDVATGHAIPTLGYAVLRRVEEYVRYPSAIERYTAELTQRLCERLSEEERRHLHVRDMIQDTLVQSERAQNVKQSLIAALDTLSA